MTPLLLVTGLQSGYGGSQILFNIELRVDHGEVVTLLGRNGMGKTTTISTIMGMLKPTAGVIKFEGRPIAGLPSYEIARAGIGLVPEGRQIFPNLTVEENLVATAFNRFRSVRPWTFEAVIELFPRLRNCTRSLGGVLSGGEQQMLAIGRALMTNPKLLILDEATEGLAPLIREEIWRVIEAIKSTGQSTLIVDKNIDALSRLASRHYVIEKGSVVWSGSSAQLQKSPDVQERYIGL